MEVAAAVEQEHPVLAVRRTAAMTMVVETMGLEPTTPCLQSRCSSQLSYVPVVGARSG